MFCQRDAINRPIRVCFLTEREKKSYQWAGRPVEKPGRYANMLCEGQQLPLIVGAVVDLGRKTVSELLENPFLSVFWVFPENLGARDGRHQIIGNVRDSPKYIGVAHALAA